MLANGIHELRIGQLAALVTHLRHDGTALPPRSPLPAGYTFQRLGGADVGRYRAIFREIGGEWLWFSRLRMVESVLAAILSDVAVHALVLSGPAGDAGLLELDFRDAANPELAFCGIAPALVGTGLGRVLIAEALHRARESGARALHVHTCSLDHPRALAFYERAGFRPFRRALEIFDDPRLDGTLPREVARQVPLLDGEPDQNRPAA